MMAADTVRDVMKRQWDAAQQGKLSLWTVFEKPRDYPDSVIARRSEIEGGGIRVTHDVLISVGLADMRSTFEKAGLTKIPRWDDDESHIVEVWL